MTRVNIAIPDDLHKKLKLEALKRDMTLKDYVIQILEERTRGGPS